MNPHPAPPDAPALRWWMVRKRFVRTVCATLLVAFVGAMLKAYDDNRQVMKQVAAISAYFEAKEAYNDAVRTALVRMGAPDSIDQVLVMASTEDDVLMVVYHSAESDDVMKASAAKMLRAIGCPHVHADATEAQFAWDVLCDDEGTTAISKSEADYGRSAMYFAKLPRQALSPAGLEPLPAVPMFP